MMNQYTNRAEVAPGDIKRWRELVPSLIEKTKQELEQRGYEPIAAPEMPPLRDGLQGYSLPEWRILFMWVPYWSTSEDRGKFVVRVDTLARKAEL